MINYLQTEDVIIAQCTSSGPGAINVVRISGLDLSKLYKEITKSKIKPKANTIHYKNVFWENELIDRCLVSFFKGPNSFTGEDVIEINCHGGDVISKKIIQKITNFSAVRIALPGEFTFRSYYNGKIDILQAESINELIKSQTNVYANKTMENIDGRISNKIKKIKQNLMNISSQAEYDLDIDELDDEITNKDTVKTRIKSIQTEVWGLTNCSMYSNIIRDGLRIALVGKPNVGKSTMFNYLLGYDRSIVSSKAGTTRDTVEAVLELNGHKVVFVDTAGYRSTDEEIENMGIQKTKSEISSADIILFLCENDSDLELLNNFSLNKKYISILSKSDINSSELFDVKISSKDGVGFERLFTQLSTKIDTIISDKDVSAEFYINKRQHAVLKELLEKVEVVIHEINSNVERDILATLIKDLIDTLNEIIDPINKEDVINNIFANFCVGK